MNHDSCEARCSVSYALLAGDSVCLSVLCRRSAHSAAVYLRTLWAHSCSGCNDVTATRVPCKRVCVCVCVRDREGEAVPCGSPCSASRSACKPICCSTDTVCLFGLCPSSNFQNNTTFRKPDLLPSSDKEARHFADPLGRATPSQWAQCRRGHDRPPLTLTYSIIFYGNIIFYLRLFYACPLSQTHYLVAKQVLPAC